MNSVHDSNNNATEKSYSLRPRSTARKEDQEEHQQTETWKPRSRRKKTKQKSLPLSKYRRKTANARERYRMREINEAFEALRRAIPHLTLRFDNPNEKLTKISTLRLAMKYIKALSNVLHEDFDSDAESFLSDWTFSLSDTRESSTPSSINDHPDSYEHFFSSSSSSSESSPLAASSCGLSSVMTTRSPHDRTNFSPECLVPIQDSLDTFSSKVNPLDRYNPACLPASPPLEPLPNHSFFLSDLPGCDSYILEQLDDLSTNSMDLDEYLIT